MWKNSLWHIYEKDDKEIVDSMTFIDHSKNVDIKEQKAKNLDETYEFDISPERFEWTDLDSLFRSENTSY